MASYKTSGIVLKGTNFGEADKILTIFTERFGKIKVMAKGVRKIKSHLAGSLEPFMIVGLQLHEGKTFYIVTGAVIGDEFENLHNDLGKTAKAFYLGELVDRFAQEKQKADGIYELFSKALSEVDQGLSGPTIQAFELKLIGISGFQPDLYNCIVCKENLQSGNNFFDSQNGGVVCGACAKNFSYLPKIDDRVLKIMHFIGENKSEQITKLKVDETDQNKLEALLDLYLKSVLERELKSKTFLRQIVKN